MTIRGPLITPARNRGVPQQPRVPANLLQTTLAPAGAVQAPFNRTDWPNPVIRGAYRRIFVAENLLQTTLAPSGAVQAPFNRTEWPNPIRAPLSMSRHFLVTTSFFDSPVPDIKFDFQNPTVKRKVQQPDIFPNRVLGFAFPPQKQRAEFQNPLPARRVQQHDGLPNLVLNTLYVAPTVPQVRAEFQNPTIARRVTQPDVFPNLQTGTLYVPPPSTPSETGTISIILRNRQLLLE